MAVTAGRKINEINTYAFKVNDQIIKVRSRNQANAVATVSKQLGISNTKLRQIGLVTVVTPGQSFANFGQIF